MNGPSCPWSFLPPQPSVFCETELCAWVVQPANTWSNIGYLIVAILVWRSRRADLKTEKLFFGASMLTLFIGSTFFHLSGSHIGKVIDVSAMFVFSMGVLSLALQRFFSWPDRRTIAFFVVGLVLSISFLLYFGFGNIPFALQILTAAALEFWLIRTRRGVLEGKTLLLACATQAVAFIFWILDVKKVLCWPDNHILTGHGVWHLLSALAIYLLFISKKITTANDR